MFVIIFPTFLNVIYLDIHLRGLIFEVMKLLLENKKKYGFMIYVIVVISYWKSYVLIKTDLNR